MPAGPQQRHREPQGLGDALSNAAAGAEALMRSRYDAFVACDEAHLLATWHPSTRPARVDFAPGAKWLGLEVRGHRLVDAAHAEVEFVARYRGPDGRAVRLHERSRFVHDNGRWYYVDGDML
jgi:SEC-C motif-containing protein